MTGESASATASITDRHTGGWGHINADHFVQGDTKRQVEPAGRELTVTEAPVIVGFSCGA